MKRQDFIKTVGISCMGACFKPLGVLAASNASLKSYTSYTGAYPTRLNSLSTSTAGITSLDDMAYDPEPLLKAYDEKKQARLFLPVITELCSLLQVIRSVICARNLRCDLSYLNTNKEKIVTDKNCST